MTKQLAHRRARKAHRILRKLRKALKALPLLTAKECVEEVRREQSIH